MTSNLEAIKQQLTAAQAAATKQQAAAQGDLKRQAARQQQRLSATAQAFKTAVGLLLSCMSTMAAAASVLQQSTLCLQQQRQADSDIRGSCVSLPGAAAPQLCAANAAGGDDDSAAAVAAAAAAAAAGVALSSSVAAGLADMVCLSGEELADLLGPEDDTCRMLLLELQQHQQAAAGAAAAAGQCRAAVIMPVSTPACQAGWHTGHVGAGGRGGCSTPAASTAAQQRCQPAGQQRYHFC